MTETTGQANPQAAAETGHAADPTTAQAAPQASPGQASPAETTARGDHYTAAQAAARADYYAATARNDYSAPAAQVAPAAQAASSAEPQPTSRAETDFPAAASSAPWTPLHAARVGQGADEVADQVTVVRAATAAPPGPATLARATEALAGGSPADPGSRRPIREGTATDTPIASATMAAVVKGRVQIEDTVVEKIAALATVEVPGVFDLGGALLAWGDDPLKTPAAPAWGDDPPRPPASGMANHGERTLGTAPPVRVGRRRASRGAHVRIEDRQVWIHTVIVIEYGAVVMDVAKAVKANVARAVSRMLGLRVVEVNVTVDDVAMPRMARTGERGDISADPVPATAP